MFIILKQRTDTIKVGTDVSIDNEEDVTGNETDEVSVPQEYEPEVSHILRQFLWWLLLYIFLWFCTPGTAEMVDFHSCLYGALHLLRC